MQSLTGWLFWQLYTVYVVQSVLILYVNDIQISKIKAPLFNTQNRTFTSAGTIPVHVDYRHFSLMEDEYRWVLYLLKLSKIERIMDNH